MRTQFVAPSAARGISRAASLTILAVVAGGWGFVLHTNKVEDARRGAEFSVLKDVADVLRKPCTNREDLLAAVTEREQDALRGRYARRHGLLMPQVEARMRQIEKEQAAHGPKSRQRLEAGRVPGTRAAFMPGLQGPSAATPPREASLVTPATSSVL